MLNLAGIPYESFETDSANYVEDWVSQHEKFFNFTDIVVVGGDGLFGQLINALANSSLKEELIKIPIGLLPGGSQNALCWDLGGRDVYQASINILRGKTIPSDIMEVNFSGLHLKIYATTILWGLTADVAHKAEKWRKLFRSARYAVWATHTFFWNLRKKRYTWKIKYQNNHEEHLKQIEVRDEESKTFEDPKEDILEEKNKEYYIPDWSLAHRVNQSKF